MEERKRQGDISVNRSVLLVLVAGIFAVGVFVGRGTWLFGTAQDGPRRLFSPRQAEEFRFIRQSSLPDSPGDGRKVRELQPFRYKVTALIDEKVSNEDVQSASVYFRDLDNGNWFGIRDNEQFSPESQLKLPLMLAYFKWAESNPMVLRKKLTMPLGDVRRERLYLRPPQELKPGTTYSVNDLLFRMIAYSDNDAYALLAANLPPAQLHRIFKDLYVNYDPSQQGGSLSLSAYASFFRVLFNSSYLTEEMSEKSLRYLSRSSFRKGMAAGTPPGIEIASKAGERAFSVGGDEDESSLFQLHEFGIIYHPYRPFLLGITVRGTDFDTLAATIRDITRLIYTEVDLQSE